MLKKSASVIKSEDKQEKKMNLQEQKLENKIQRELRPPKDSVLKAEKRFSKKRWRKTTDVYNT